MANNNASNLWKKEDWLAVWIGFIVIAIGCISILTQSFDFSAAKFSTWHWWENVDEKKSLIDQFNGAFWIKLLRTFLVLGILFAIGIKLQGEKIGKFIPAFIVLFIICIVVRLVSAEFTLNRYLEWAFWALLIGLLISNTVGTPEWLKPAIRTEFYIKTGLVIMGFSVLFSNIAKFGLYGLGIAWIVTPIVIIFMWWLGTKVLKIDNKRHRHGCCLQSQEGRPLAGHQHLHHLHHPDDGIRTHDHPCLRYEPTHGRCPHRRHRRLNRCCGAGW